jgi:predicted regulator of Ras-like GTPase activity (Roadblock/LC7/MglB family)
MSAVSQRTGIRFFGMLKNLFSKPEPSGNGTSSADLPEEPASDFTPPPTDSVSPVRTQAPKTHDNDGTKIVVLSLQTIIASMSRDLRAKVRAAVSDDLTVSVPIEKVLPQLGKGTVRIPYGDVRRAAPHVFAPGGEYDNLPVVLPLSEILPRIKPSQLTRRSDQKQVEPISNDIASPFAAGGHGLTISKESPRPTPSTQFVRRVPPPVVPRAPQTVAPPRLGAKTQRISFTAAQETPVARTTPVPMSPPESDSGPIFVPVAKPVPVSRQQPPITPIAPAAPPPAPVLTSVPEARPIAFPLAEPQPAEATDAAPAPAATSEASAPAIAPVPATPLAPVAAALPPLVVGLSELAENWPETLRQEIVKLELIGSRVALPSDLVEEGLKRGRVTVQWNSIRSWIQPSAPTTPSVHDEIEVDLPLKVLAPMYFTRQKSSAGSRHSSVSVDEAIPNLFFGFPQGESAAPEPAAVSPGPAPLAFAQPPAPAKSAPPVAPAAAPSARASAPVQSPRAPDTNYYVWDDNAETAFVDETEYKRKPASSRAGGTDFVVRYATPNEIVSRAAALDGVAGALIALPDGLMVANKIPQDLNGDTLAAFLPQLFSKMSQCTKELRMGELNNLNFTVGNIPWKIFRVNAVFFAAFGHVGQGLPTAQLAALAGELDRRNKR